MLLAQPSTSHLIGNILGFCCTEGETKVLGSYATYVWDGVGPANCGSIERPTEADLALA